MRECKVKLSITVCSQGQVRKDDRAGKNWPRAISHWQTHTDQSASGRNHKRSCSREEKSCRKREEDYLGDRSRMQLNARGHWRRETSAKETIEWSRWYADTGHRLNKQVLEQLWDIGEHWGCKLHDWPRIWVNEPLWTPRQATAQHVKLHHAFSKHP